MPPRFAPLGDQAVLAYCEDETAAVRFAAAVRNANPDWLQDVVPAYASVGVFFDADRIRTPDVIQHLTGVPDSPHREESLRRFEIPVCYEFGPDLPRISERTGVSSDDIIRLHGSVEYAAYAIGFVPGFPYLGYLPEELCGVPRLDSPRLRVEPGSVGLTGRQTGIYPLPRPGGWNLVGRTPLTIVDVVDEFFPLRVGDRIRFTRIDEKRYGELEGERLA